ncbi:hypothetical protein KBD59_00620 [Candidatus Gracilibacteria bacterium]|nr:hypothetical protein [Candidatus Gracilibacteria bacterium]
MKHIFLPVVALMLLTACTSTTQPTVPDESATTPVDAISWQTGVNTTDSVAFPLRISHPSNYTFDCCGDNSKGFGGRIENKAGAEKGEISFFNTYLKVCSKKDNDCGVDDELTTVTADEFFASMKEKTLAAVNKDETILQTVPQLAHFKDAFGARSATGEEYYYINTGTEFVGIFVNKPDTIGRAVVDQFLTSLNRF